MDKQKKGRPPVLPIAAMLFWNYSRKTRRKHSQVDVAHVDQLTDTQSYYWYLSRHDAEKPFGSYPPTHGVLYQYPCQASRQLSWDGRVRTERGQSGRRHCRGGHCRGEGEDGRIPRQRDTSSAPSPGREHHWKDLPKERQQLTGNSINFCCTTSPAWLVAHALSPTIRVFPGRLVTHLGIHRPPHITHITSRLPRLCSLDIGNESHASPMELPSPKLSLYVSVAWLPPVICTSP